MICPVCDSSDLLFVGSYRNIHPSFSGLNKAFCKSCELVFANPMPSEKVLEVFNSCYFDSAHGGLAKNLSATAFFKAIARIRGAHLKKYCYQSNIELNTILEIGPGPGFFAENWLQNNPKTKYFAFETDRTCFESLNKIGVKVLSEGEEYQEVDAVVISHVLEHVNNPQAFLLNVTSKLKKGGILFIEVPCNDYEHKSLDEPHLLFFNKKPMKLLLEQLHFNNIYVSYHGKEISELKKKSFINSLTEILRVKLISFGIYNFSSKSEVGLESVKDPLERASVINFKAHIENDNPSWWLRAISIKS